MKEQEAIDTLLALGYEKPCRLEDPDVDVLNVADVKCPNCGLQMEQINSIGWRTRSYKYGTGTAFMVCSNEGRKWNNDMMQPSLFRYNTNGCRYMWRITYRKLGQRELQPPTTK